MTKPKYDMFLALLELGWELFVLVVMGALFIIAVKKLFDGISFATGYAFYSVVAKVNEWRLKRSEYGYLRLARRYAPTDVMPVPTRRRVKRSSNVRRRVVVSQYRRLRSGVAVKEEAPAQVEQEPDRANWKYH